MNSTRTPRIRGLARLLALSLTAFAASAAFAQPTADEAGRKNDETLTLDKFVVTGSLIPATQGETFIPVSVYTSTKLTLLGAATPIEGLRSLPSFFGGTDTELDSNGGSGAATVNLRGLGGTLTLVNGRRSGVTEGVGFSDLNLIPIDAIQSIDILKDGAGSVYGADALAGVVNVVLKKKWTGTQFRASYGVSGENDAQQWDASLALGRPFGGGKGYVTLVAAYADKETLYARDRGISALADGRPLGGQNGGSPTFAGRVGAAGGGLLLNTGKDFPSSPADYHAFNPSTESFNFRDYSPSIPGQTRKLLHFAAGYELLGRKVEPYVEFDYADQFTSNGLAPAPFTLPNATARDSRYNPWGVGVAIPGNTVRYRPTDQGNRNNAFDKQNYRAVFGLQGRFDNGWGYDTAYLKTNEDLLQTESNGVLRSRIVAETDAGRFNPFARAGSKGTFNGSTWDNGKAMAASLAEGHKTFQDTLETFDFKMFGPAFELPAGPTNIAIGYGRRKAHSTFSPEDIYFSGDLLGYNASNPRDASSKNDAFFGELSVPLVAPENDVKFVKELSLTANVRYDNDEVKDNLTGAGRTFGASTHRFGLRFQPLDEIVFRATYGTGFRVPSLTQLYAAPGDNNPTLIDPLRFPIGQQTQVTTQGNPELDPETSVSRGAGFIFSPKKVPGLNITVDYYKTKLAGLITDGAQYILNQNAATQGPGFVFGNPATINPNALYADRIVRDPVTGSLDDSVVNAIDSTNLNVAERLAEGIDYSISYRQPKASWGQLTHTLEVNQVLKWQLVPETGSPVQDWVGKFVDPSSNAIAPGSIPEWKGYYNLLLEKDAWTFSLTVNYIHTVLDDPAAQYNAVFDANGNYVSSAYLDVKTGQDVTTTDISMERYVTFDFYATYTFKTDNKWLKDTELRFGVQNIGDEPPPFSAGAFNDNYDTSMYSTRGRFFQFGVVRKF